MKICKLMELIELMGEHFSEFTIDEIRFVNELKQDTIGIYYGRMLFQFFKKENKKLHSNGSEIYAYQGGDYVLSLSISEETRAVIRETDQNDIKEIVDRLVEKGYNFFIYKDDDMVLSYTNEFCTGQGYQIPNGKPRFVGDDNHINLRVPILG